MHIDHDQMVLETESDVEQKVIMPLLTSGTYLGIPQSGIFTKKYLAPTELDKKAGRAYGYYPDYSVWMKRFPVLIVEAKAPDEAVEIGYREAALYARHLNQSYPTNINPAGSFYQPTARRWRSDIGTHYPCLRCPFPTCVLDLSTWKD